MRLRNHIYISLVISLVFSLTGVASENKELTSTPSAEKTLVEPVLNVAIKQPRSKITVSQLSLEKLMSNSDWMGNSPESPLWSYDSQSIDFKQKSIGHNHKDHLQLNVTTFNMTVVGKNDELLIASDHARFNKAKSLGVFIYQDDVYLIEPLSKKVWPVMLDKRVQTNAQFVDDKTISYLVNYQIFLYHLETHLEQEIASFMLSASPDKDEKPNYLQQSQLRNSQYLQKTGAEEKFQKQRRESQMKPSSKIWYLGENTQITTFQLSPDTKKLLLGTVKYSVIAANDKIADYVTGDGYVNDTKVRPLVGTSKALNESFYLIDLVKHKKIKLDLANLPGIHDDPLKSIRRLSSNNVNNKQADKIRSVYAHKAEDNRGVKWSSNSEKVALMIFSYDNKDRWILSYDVEHEILTTAHWLSDDAWVNDWAFNEFGWLTDNKTLYYLSEEKGFSHIYLKKGKRRATQLTQGDFEVSQLSLTLDGTKIYYKANKNHPGIYEIYGLNLINRQSFAITDLGGMNDYILSPDEKKLLITHSSLTHKPELYLKVLLDSTKAKQLTETVSEEFSNILWQQPKIIKINSSHVKSPIYSRLYLPIETKDQGETRRSKIKVAAKLNKNIKSQGKNKSQNKNKLQNKIKGAAVIFVHGAGYLQNAHYGWSSYFREYLFHQYLIAKGYTVLDMDYRASKGYGRDWRTAIYRNMGAPELDDLKDGVNWLVDNANIARDRIAVYGGSYGGFMTFMALFKEPDLFAAGAALRPVSDWSHYNHQYTSNILNTPEVDPQAYQRSSPIEFAKGLKKPLLICHGMVDDNVFFKDSVRLVQKLIELKKTQYFEMAIYPVESHGFKQPSSWLDEYSRIEHLFNRTIGSLHE